MNWRYIEGTDTELLKQAYEWEKGFPVFYREANAYWRTTFTQALEFYSKCILYGLFENGEFVGMVFMEHFGADHLNAHLDLKRGHTISPELIAEVRDDQFNKGIKSIQVWTMTRNRPIMAIMKAAGFDETGLTMRQGRSHGKVLRWSQMCAAV